MTDQEIINKAFTITSDNRVVVKAPFVRVYIPEDFFNRKISEMIGSDISTIGIFYIDVYGIGDKGFDIDNLPKPKRILFKMPMQMTLCPSNITEMRDDEKNLVSILEFLEGDTFIKSVLFVRSWKTVSKTIDLLLKGFIPKELGYDQILTFIDECCVENKTNTQIADTILEILIAELSRDPNDLIRPFRLAVRDNPKIKMTEKQFVKIDNLGRMYNTFAAISSGDPKQGITTSINRKRYKEEQKSSTIEDALSDV
ncbi:MAG: hypothetical protein ACRC5M_04695 [Anaeroplasmataceae bacterium]